MTYSTYQALHFEVVWRARVLCSDQLRVRATKRAPVDICLFIPAPPPPHHCRRRRRESGPPARLRISSCQCCHCSRGRRHRPTAGARTHTHIHLCRARLPLVQSCRKVSFRRLVNHATHYFTLHVLEPVIGSSKWNNTIRMLPKVKP